MSKLLLFELLFIYTEPSQTPITAADKKCLPCYTVITDVASQTADSDFFILFNHINSSPPYLNLVVSPLMVYKAYLFQLRPNTSGPPTTCTKTNQCSFFDVLAPEATLPVYGRNTVPEIEVNSQ